MAFRSPQRWQGLGFSLIDCSPEALRVGGLVSSFSVLTERSQFIQRVSGYELTLFSIVTINHYKLVVVLSSAVAIYWGLSYRTLDE